MKWTQAIVFGATLLLAFGKTSVVKAEDSADYIKERFYIGGFGSSINLDKAGGFDGTWGFSMPSSGNEVDLIPTITRNFGFGGLVGYRTGAYAAEISYWRSAHDATWTFGGTPYYSTASLQAVNVDFKRYLFTHLPIQPFASAGMSFPWLVTHNASSIDGITFSDSTISGMGFDFGVGLEVYLADRFSIVGGAVQRWAGFNQINGFSGQAGNNLFVDGNSSDVTNLEGDGIAFYLGSTVNFE